MEKKTLNYALKNLLDIHTKENFYIHNKNIYLEFLDGRTIKLHEEEVLNQAIEYLEREIAFIKSSN